MKITLSAPALRALIADDAEFHLSLRGAVLKAASDAWRISLDADSRNWIAGQVLAALSEIKSRISEDMSQRLGTWEHNRYQPTKPVLDKISQLAEASVTQFFNETVRAKIDSSVDWYCKNTLTERFSRLIGPTLVSRIQEEIEKLLTEQIRRQLAEAVAPRPVD